MCASGVSEFYFFPAECDLLQYDGIAVDAIVKNRNSEVDSCDVPFLQRSCRVQCRLSVPDAQGSSALRKSQLKHNID